MRTLIAMLAGALIAAACVGVLVHSSTTASPAQARVLFSYGSG